MEPVAAKGESAESKFRIRFKYRMNSEQNKEAADHEVISSDRSLGSASNDDDTRARRVSNDEELAYDRDQRTESQNVGDETVVEDLGSSERRIGDVQMAEGAAHTCVECGKAFSSPKALYGHLRCHPLRRYRGAHRPPEAKKLKTIASSSSSYKVPTANRGPKEILDSEDPETNAANILMQLSRSNDQQEADWLQYKGKSRVLEERDVEGEGLQLMAAMHPENADGIEKECTDIVEAASNQPKKKKKKMTKVKDLESVHESSPPTRGREYTCSICSKSFSTHQALGGHRASHTNKNNSEAAGKTEESSLGHAEELVDSNNLVPRAEHRCTVCAAVFPTGQALGGHMRKHWTGPAPTAASPPAPSESVKKANSTVSLDIDLNELPKLEEDEQP